MGVLCSRCCLKSESIENGDIGRPANRTSRNEIEGLQRNRSNVYTERTKRDSLEWRKYPYRLPRSESRAGIDIGNYHTQDRTSQNVDSAILYRGNRIEKLHRSQSNVYTDRTKRDSFEWREYPFGLPRIESSTGKGIINYDIPNRTYQNAESDIPYRENEIDNLKRSRSNVYTERTKRYSFEGMEYLFRLPRSESRTGINSINYGTQDRTSQHSERNIPYRENSIESLQRSRSSVYTDRTTKISVNGSEYSFDLPRSESNPGIFIINDYRRQDRTSLNAERNDPYMGGIFTCGHTNASFERYVQKKWNDFPAGNFIDCRNIAVRNSVRALQQLIDWSHSVCQIQFGTCTATGFRVGSKYIMTALHVVKTINREYSDNQGEVQLIRNSTVTALAHRNVFCVFDYFDKNQFENVRTHFFKTTLHFYDEETDTAVLELSQNHDSIPLPPPFLEFGLPYIGGKFTFLGHERSEMEYNVVDLLIDKDHKHTREDIRYVNEYNNDIARENYECPPHNTLDNEHRLLFHCQFGKGASGSPGILVQEDGRVVVVTMLLCGYPNWYYDHNIDRNLLQQWPKELCIEQGADMISVGKKMYMHNPDLHEEIFQHYNIPVPSTH